MTMVAFDPTADWPEPDQRLVNGGVRPAPRFPIEAFGPLARYVADLAAAKDGPSDYLALALLTAAAGVLGGARSVELRRGWIEPCILWGLLVGNPSTGKSQPLDLIKRAVRAIEPDDAPDFDAQHRAWKEAAAVASEVEAHWQKAVKAAIKAGDTPTPRPMGATAPPEPLRPRIVIGNITVERLGHLFAAFPRGLMLVLDEGAAWFGNFGKYGGDGDAAFFLSAFTGIGTIVDRVKEGGSVAPATAILSACAGIQPDRLVQLLLGSRADDGLVSRFLVVWPDPVPPCWDTPRVDGGRIEGLLRQLRSLRPTSDENGAPSPSILKLDATASVAFSRWWTAKRIASQSAAGLLAGFLGKCTGMAGRLALVIELLTWASIGGPEPTAITLTSIEAAIKLIDDYFVPMAERVYGDAARPPEERDAVALLRAIQARGARTLNQRGVYKNWGVSGLSKAKAVASALAVLEEGDCVRPIRTTGVQGGRPAVDFLVNPRLPGAMLAAR